MKLIDNDNEHYDPYLLYQECIKCVLIDFSLTVKAATLIFKSGCGSAISSAYEGKSGFFL